MAGAAPEGDRARRTHARDCSREGTALQTVSELQSGVGTAGAQGLRGYLRADDHLRNAGCTLACAEQAHALHAKGSDEAASFDQRVSSRSLQSTHKRAVRLQ